MVALFHRHTEAPPQPRACTAHALYTVVTCVGETPVCAVHLRPAIGQHLAEGVHIAGPEPEPGTPCEYLEVSRGA